jgi:serine/threonine protein kinase
VKAANILVSEKLEIKIADFGVSDSLGNARDTIGTPYWY